MGIILTTRYMRVLRPREQSVESQIIISQFNNNLPSISARARIPNQKPSSQNKEPH